MERFQYVVYAAKRRARLSDAGKCINGARHDLPAPGRVRCEWCCLVHKIGSQMARELAKSAGNPQPPALGKRSAA